MRVTALLFATLALAGAQTITIRAATMLDGKGGGRAIGWDEVRALVAEQKNRELAAVKVRYLERQRQADAYKHRVDVIDQLRSNQSGPVSLLAMIGDTVNSTEAVWLNSMQDQGASVAIDGTALSSDAVANLISNLQKTGFFRNIEIKESYQDDAVKDMQAFQFTLTCEKAKS